MIIGIDMGHSLSGAGTGASDLLSEVKENRIIGKKLITMLKDAGHKVVNCSNDKAYSINEQLGGIKARANKQYLDLFVSIHLNSGGGHGTEVYVYNGNFRGKESIKAKAKIVNDAVVSSCGFRNRGVKEANFYVLRETKAPAMLVEVCFVDSAEDKRKLDETAVAKAMFKGITGKTYSNKTQTKPTNSVSGKYGIVTASVLNVRKGAGTGYAVVGQLKRGDKVQLDVKVGAWWSTYYGEHGGFVHGDYIKVV